VPAVPRHLAKGLAPAGEVGEHGGVDVAGDGRGGGWRLVAGAGGGVGEMGTRAVHLGLSQIRLGLGSVYFGRASLKFQAPIYVGSASRNLFL